jgi:hypothetical protein
VANSLSALFPLALAPGDAVLVDDDFVKHLFDIIEEVSDDVNDPYHYPVIRVLVEFHTHSCGGFTLTTNL